MLRSGAEALDFEIRAAHQRSRKTYGPRRIQPEPMAIGVQAGRDRSARLRRSMGLYCRQRRRFKVTTDSHHNLPVAPRRLGIRSPQRHGKREIAQGRDTLWSHQNAIFPPRIGTRSPRKTERGVSASKPNRPRQRRPDPVSRRNG
ncbi:MAG: IS3 family transposase [Steroidobacteraceae bacterium]